MGATLIIASELNKTQSLFYSSITKSPINSPITKWGSNALDPQAKKGACSNLRP